MRKHIRLITALACGLLAVLLAFAYGEQARAEVRAERSEVLERYGGEVTNLVVARRELASGEVISENNLEVQEWLADLAPEGAITDVSEVVGLRLSNSVAKGEPLNALDVASQEGALDIPDGRVAISVYVNDKTGLAQSVANGARVLCYRSVDDGLKAICSDAFILANGVSGTSSLSTSTGTICLAVLPTYVEDVLAASSDGSLRLALPGEGVAAEEALDNEPAETEAETKSEAEGDALEATTDASEENEEGMTND